MAAPADWVECILPVTCRSEFVYDAELTSGNLPIVLDWDDGPLHETFVRPDGTMHARRVYPSSKGGLAWSVFSGGFNFDGGAGRATSLSALAENFTAYNAGAVISQFGADFDVTVELTIGTTGAGLIYRIVNENNHLRCWFDVASGRLKATNGQTGTTVISTGQTRTLRVTESGNSFNAYIDGVLEMSWTETAHAGSTGGGLLSLDTDSVFHELFEVGNEAFPPDLTYTVRNIANQILVAETAVTSRNLTIPDSVHLQQTGLGPYGWYRLRLKGPDRLDDDWRESYGVLSYVRLKDTASLPANPARTVAAAGPNDMDPIAHNVAGLGPIRFSVLQDASATDAGFRAEVLAGAEQCQTYYRSLAHASRPRHTMVLFSVGTYGLTAGTVTTWVSELKHVVDVWECYNEPDIQGYAFADIQTFIDREVVPFYEEVKAEDPTALVIAPCLVNALNGEAWLRDFLTRITALPTLPIDGMSFHPYNCWDDIQLTKRYMALVRDLLTDFDLDIPVFQTEQGNLVNGYYDLMAPNRGGLEPGADYSVLAFDQELGGMPMENSTRWYDLKHGFAEYPANWLITGEGPSQVACTMRTMSGELHDKPHSSLEVLDFGDDGDVYVGGIWTAASGDAVIGLRAQAYNGLPNVRLAVTGASTLVFVDPYGNEDTLGVVSGFCSVPVTKLPSWVRVPDGVTAALVPGDWDHPNLATTATASTTETSTDIANINDGSMLTGWTQNSTATLPDVHTLTFPSAIELSRIVAMQPATRNNDGAWLDVTIEVSPDGSTGWTEVYEFVETAATTEYVRTDAADTAIESMWQERNVHWADFDQQQVKAIRITVNDVSRGGYYDLLASQAHFAPDGVAKYDSIRDIRAYNVEPVASTQRTVLLLAP